MTQDREQPSLNKVATALSLDVGVLYSGVYEIGERLGVGGTGTVYRARHVILEQERALKILHPQTFGGPRFVDRLQLEASVFGRLKGEPTVVMPFDLGFDAATGTHFLAMELLEGCDLASWVRAQGPLNVRTTVALMGQVARGLDAAHRYVNARGQRTPIVHRDLTPTNVFVVKPERATPVAKILDFGLADMLDESSRTHGRRSGTPLYRSYEQAHGLDVVPQTDVWALALVVHFALTGVPYWLSREASALHAEITRGPIEPPSERLQRRFSTVRLPGAFDEWFARCLRRLPARRYGSAGEAIDELQLCFSQAGFDVDERVVSVEPDTSAQRDTSEVEERRQALVNPPRVYEAVGESQTVSRFDEAPLQEPHLPGAVLTEYLAAVHPVLKSVVRLGDDLMTATGHYLAFAPESPACLTKQLEGVAHAVKLYNAASGRMRGPLGVGVFAHGIEQAILGDASATVSEGLHALLALPERYAEPGELTAGSAAANTPSTGPWLNQAALALVPGAMGESATLMVEYCAHSTHWQMERVRLQARLEVAKRSLIETEQRIESAVLKDERRELGWAERAQAALAAESLIAQYKERMRELGVAIDEWLEVIAPASVTGRDASDSDRRRQLTQAAWRLAEPIERMNGCYVSLEERGLALRLALLDSKEPGQQRWAQTLFELQSFQWYEVRPQLNGLLVNVIRLLCTEDTEQAAPSLPADYLGWQRLRQMLTRARSGVET